MRCARVNRTRCCAPPQRSRRWPTATPARRSAKLRCRADATGSYEAVVRGYPLEPEAPAAAYLAGVGLLAQNRPLAAAPYFQLVLDRYAGRSDPNGLVVFASPEHQELVEAALCLL